MARCRDSTVKNPWDSLLTPEAPQLPAQVPRPQDHQQHPRIVTLRTRTSQRSQNRQGWDVVSTCQAKGLRAARPSWPWAQAHPRAREQAGQREGAVSARALSCYFISWPCLMVLWVPRQLHLSGLLEPSSTQVGTLPTAHPGTGRPTASGSPPLSNQSWRGREARNQTSQYTDPASPQGLNGAPITQVTRSLGTGLWCDGGGGTPLALPLALA